MSHWRSMFDNKFLGSWDLEHGRDYALTIDRVEAGELTAQGGRTSKKPLVYFRGKDKPFALNKTNAKCIAAIYGHDTGKWKGRRIAIYVTTTQSPEGVVDCIRVRPTPPAAGKPTNGVQRPEPPPPPEREPGSDDVPETTAQEAG